MLFRLNNDKDRTKFCNQTNYELILLECDLHLHIKEKSVKLSKNHSRDFQGNFQGSLKVGAAKPCLLFLFDIPVSFNY